MRTRYDRSLFYLYNTDAEDFDSIESPFEDKIQSLPVLGEFAINSGNAHSIDDIANSIYSDPEMWWIIAEYNSIEDVFNLVPGTKLYYPSISDIEELLFSVSSSLNVFED